MLDRYSGSVAIMVVIFNLQQDFKMNSPQLPRFDLSTTAYCQKTIRGIFLTRSAVLILPWLTFPILSSSKVVLLLNISPFIFQYMSGKLTRSTELSCSIYDWYFRINLPMINLLITKGVSPAISFLVKTTIFISWLSYIYL